jgi:hypothetical protein
MFCLFHYCCALLSIGQQLPHIHPLLLIEIRGKARESWEGERALYCIDLQMC